ncbi:MAG: YbgC/FadM family acyl-CoA thioesterase [Candidatus Omnitrophota bacterium]
MSKKIHYHDTDCGGVVYYANYLKYFEEARTEFMSVRGVDIGELAKKGTLFVVRKVEIDYKSPAHYGDNLTIFTMIIKIKNVSLEFFQEAKRDSKVLAYAKTKLVCIGNDFSPKALSPKVAQCLKNE